jgi:N-acetylmuramoyl-L-alanine amidase
VIRNPVVTRPTPTPFGALIYRVVVVNASEMAQQQVRSVVPQAFRTSLNGQSVIQAGVFREQSKAVELQQLLNRNNVQASVLSGQVNDLPVNPPRVESPTNPDVTPLPSVPRNGRIVVIDPGHGGGDPGAVGIGGLRESEAVLDISRQVVSLLKQQGVEAVLTRTRDEEIELEPRVQFAERANADVFVSIHANAFDARRTDVNGIETYYFSGGSGQPLARAVQDSLLQELGARDRGVRTANFYVIKYTSMPAILVETGFVTGSEDAARLASPTGRTRIARAIARGILQYMK